jgi:tripartite-type tricarboxylate transporter receptor subunit TctC
MTHRISTRPGLLLATLLATLAFPQPADAQAYPSRTVRLVVPFSPGGATDMIARLLADGLGNHWDIRVVPEYRPGGGTVVGSDYVARAAPDGYTLGIVVTSFVIHPALRGDLPYTLADFRGITQIGEAPIVLLAHRDFPGVSIDGLVREARARPGELAYAVPGAGTALHLAGELLARRAGIDWFHVPYAGAAQALPDVLSGRVPLLFDVWHSSRGYVESGDLKVLGVTSPGGVPGHPEFGSLPEQFPGFSATSIQGLVAPAGTPDAIVAAIAGAARAVIRSPEFSERLRNFGMTGVGSAPAEFDAFLAAEVERWLHLVRDIGGIGMSGVD